MLNCKQTMLDESYLLNAMIHNSLVYSRKKHNFIVNIYIVFKDININYF